MSLTLVRITFLIAGLYDFFIGLIFIYSGKQIFEWTEVPLPNQWAYLYFCCFMLMIFGLMFFAIAIDPIANRNLMPFGMLLKLSYVSMVAYYWFVLDYCSTLFKPFAVIDAVMLVLFLIAFLKLPAPTAGMNPVKNT